MFECSYDTSYTSQSGCPTHLPHLSIYGGHANPDLTYAGILSLLDGVCRHSSYTRIDLRPFGKELDVFHQILPLSYLV